MTSMSVLMSLPLMKAVPEVGGYSPVRIDLLDKSKHGGWFRFIEEPLKVLRNYNRPHPTPQLHCCGLSCSVVP